MRTLIAFSMILCVASAARASDAPSRRFAVVAGASDGGPTRAVLRYATTDARQVARVLRRLGGVALGDLLLVEEPDAPALRAAIAKVAAETDRVRRAGQRVELFLYFSGHSNETGLLLGRSQLTYPELRAELERVPADVRVAILDSCSSGAFTRSKGGTHQPPFLLDASARVKGHAFLTSSAADEASQESERLRGSFFTHALLTGLRGGADSSNDGVVTLNEAYQFAYRETLARTEATQGGPQHATYDIGLVGSGDVVMTDLRRADAVLVIPPGLEGTVFVRNASGQLVAELRKVRGAGVELALEEGRYDLRVSLERNVSSTSIDLVSSSRVVLDPTTLTATPLEVTAARGEDATADGVGVPLALPSAGEDRPAAASVTPSPTPGSPVPRADASWIALTGGSVVPQKSLRSEFGWAVQASMGTWLLDFVGLEVSASFHEISGVTRGLLPAWYNGTTPRSATYAVFDVREKVSVIPLETTLKLALPTPGLRPYLLAGVGLVYVRLERGLLPGTPSDGWSDVRESHVVASDFAFGYHAGLGVSIPLAPRLNAVAEGRYHFALARMTQDRSNLGTTDLAGIRLTAGVGYTF